MTAKQGIIVLCIAIFVSTIASIPGNAAIVTPPTVIPPCTDLNDNCPLWAIEPLYFCEPDSEYHQFMLRDCPRSCGVCGGMKPGPKIPVDPCENIYCDYIPCMEDEAWSQDEFSCCGGCARFPVSGGCNPVYKPIFMNVKHNGVPCQTDKPMVTSGCYGVCGSYMMLLDGKKRKSCSSCDVKSTRKHQVLVTCWPEGDPMPAPYTTLYEYDVIDECSCSAQGCLDAEPATTPVEPEIANNYFDVDELVKRFNMRSISA